jgi:uncharacterized protein (TIGR00251 family)
LFDPASLFLPRPQTMSMSNLPDPRWPCLRAVEGGVVFDLSIVPGAKRTELAGLHDDALRIRLQAPPVDGKANDALIAWLSSELGVPRRSVELLRGASSRRKQVRVDVSCSVAQAWLEQRMPSR